MPLVVSYFTSVCSVKVPHMTDSVDPALDCTYTTTCACEHECVGIATAVCRFDICMLSAYYIYSLCENIEIHTLREISSTPLANCTHNNIKLTSHYKIYYNNAFF